MNTTSGWPAFIRGTSSYDPAFFCSLGIVAPDADVRWVVCLRQAFLVIPQAVEGLDGRRSGSSGDVAVTKAAGGILAFDVFEGFGLLVVNVVTLFALASRVLVWR